MALDGLFMIRMGKAFRNGDELAAAKAIHPAIGTANASPFLGYDARRLTLLHLSVRRAIVEVAIKIMPKGNEVACLLRADEWLPLRDRAWAIERP